MKDLIERQAAIKAVGFYSLHSGDKLLFADKPLKELPSAQPEIIRCKDCTKREICRTSTVWAVAPGDDWYCADAERRTNEQN